jgi:cellulose synthase operon protein C
VTSACDNLHPFADGQLDQAAHGHFEQHLAECDDCARGLTDILVLGALADQVRDDEARETQRTQTREEIAIADLPRKSWWRRRPRWRWHFSWTDWRVWSGGLGAGVVALGLLLLARTAGSPPDAFLIAELQGRPYRATEARLAVAAFSGYRPLSGERGAEQRLVDSMTTMRQQALASLERERRYHLLGAVYLLGQQYGRAARVLSLTPDSPEVWNDRAVLAYQQGQMQDAIAHAERALALAPGQGAALWNRALALEALGRYADAARGFEDCAARNEFGWSAEAALRASVLRARLSPREVPRGPR